MRLTKEEEDEVNAVEPPPMCSESKGKTKMLTKDMSKIDGGNDMGWRGR